MRTRFQTLRMRVLLALLTLAMLAACGNGRIILNLDIYSFLEPDSVRGDYDILIAPGLGWLPVVPIIPPTEISTIEGLGSVTILEEGVLFIEGEFANVTGTGEARLDLHLAASATEVFLSGTPVLSAPVQVAPNTTAPFQASIVLDEQTLALFGEPSFWVRVDMQARAPGAIAAEQLAGEAVLTGLRARVISSDDLFD